MQHLVAALEAMLAANVMKAQCERLTYQRMYEELRLVGYGGGYDAVRRYGRARRLTDAAFANEPVQEGQ